MHFFGPAGSLRVGRSGEDTPDFVVRNVVGEPAYPVLMVRAVADGGYRVALTERRMVCSGADRGWGPMRSDGVASLASPTPWSAA